MPQLPIPLRLLLRQSPLANVIYVIGDVSAQRADNDAFLRHRSIRLRSPG